MCLSASLPVFSLFRAEALRIVVLAVFHARRDPKCVAQPCITADAQRSSRQAINWGWQAKGQNFPMERPKSVTLLHVSLATREELDSVLVDVNRH